MGVSECRMLEIDWRQAMASGSVPVTQRIGQAASETGLEGLLVPSAAERQGVNLVVFPQNLRSSSSIAVIDADRLPD